MKIVDRINQIDFEMSILKTNINSTYGINSKLDVSILIQKRIYLKEEKLNLIRDLERKNKLEKLGKQIR